MAKLICVDNDNHKFGAPDSKINIMERPKKVYVDPLGTTHHVTTWVNNGDNYEINNCLKKNLEKCVNHYNLYKNVVDYNVQGNHGLDKDMPPMVIITIEKVKIAFAHGHLLLWPKQKGKDYINNNKPSCGHLKYFFAQVLHKVRGLKEYKLKDDARLRIVEEFEQNDVNALVLGHCHTREYIHELMFVGDRYLDVFLLPQGRNYFRVHNDDIEYFGGD